MFDAGDQLEGRREVSLVQSCVSKVTRNQDVANVEEHKQAIC